MIRPQLQTGDGLIFDCRILHLGLANRFHEVKDQFKHHNQDEVPVLDTRGWRPMLYVNYHQPWFIDPKNWNNNEKLFP